MKAKPFNVVKRKLGFRGEIQPGALIKKARSLGKEKLAIKGLI